MGFINRTVIGDEVVTIGGTSKVDTINTNLQETNENMLLQLRILNKNLLEMTGNKITDRDITKCK